jgi:hypothetical protein
LEEANSLGHAVGGFLEEVLTANQHPQRKAQRQLEEEEHAQLLELKNQLTREFVRALLCLGATGSQNSRYDMILQRAFTLQMMPSCISPP